MDEKDIELIDRYMNGDLSDDALKIFKDRLVSDTEFAAKVNWHEDLVGGIRKQSRNELKAYFQTVEKELKSPENEADDNKVFFSGFWKYAVAASIALVVSAVFWFNLQSPSPTTLYAQYYQPYPNVEANIERNKQDVNAYKKAFQHYEYGEYQDAAKSFDQLMEAGNSSEALPFYAGLTALELNDIEKALQYFESVMQHPDHKFYQQSIWYAALASLKNEETDSAKKYLQLLSSEKGFYGKKSKELLDDL